MQLTVGIYSPLFINHRSLERSYNQESRFPLDGRSSPSIRETKRGINRPLKLSRPDLALPYILHTDACSSEMGAALYELGADGIKKIISYASAKFKPAETRYHSNEQEYLAVVYAVKKYRHLLEDRPFTLKTDNKGLTWLKETRDKLKRWALLLQEFNVKIEHCPGKKNLFADLLSGNAVKEGTEDLSDPERLLSPEHYSTSPLPDQETDAAVYFIGSIILLEEIKGVQQSDSHHSRLAT